MNYQKAAFGVLFLATGLFYTKSRSKREIRKWHGFDGTEDEHVDEASFIVKRILSVDPGEGRTTEVDLSELLFNLSHLSDRLFQETKWISDARKRRFQNVVNMTENKIRSAKSALFAIEKAKKHGRDGYENLRHDDIFLANLNRAGVLRGNKLLYTIED